MDDPVSAAAFGFGPHETGQVAPILAGVHIGETGGIPDRPAAAISPGRGLSRRWPQNRGMAAISLDRSATAICANTRRWACTQARTRCNGSHLPRRSWDPCTYWPSIGATGPAVRVKALCTPVGKPSSHGPHPAGCRPTRACRARESRAAGPDRGAAKPRGAGPRGPRATQWSVPQRTEDRPHGQDQHSGQGGNFVRSPRGPSHCARIWTQGEVRMTSMRKVQTHSG